MLSGCLRHEPRADLVIVNGAEPESLDPALITGQPDGRAARGLFEGLTRFDPVSGKPVPGLAARWDVSPDGRLYTFHLRSNALWSTGEPIDAEDVVFSWRRVVDPATACEYAGLLFFVKNAEAIHTGQLKDVRQLGVRALDARTVQVELTSPAPFFVDQCACFTLLIVPRRVIEAQGDRWLKTRPLPASGPYMLESWRVHDRLRLRRNPRYWDAANTRNEVVDLLPLDSAAAALNLYETGQADIIWDKSLIPSELVDAFTNRADYHTFDYLGTYFIRCNVTRPPLKDPRVRQALALAVDKQRLVARITRAGERPAGSLTPPGTANYDPPRGLGHDPALARARLAEAGYPAGRGFPLIQYHFNTGKLNEQIAIELQQMWKKELGVTVELKQTEWKVFLAQQTALEYDLSRSSWVADYNDPNTFLDVFLSHSGNNRTGWKNPRYDALLRQAYAQANAQGYARFMREAETLLVQDDAPIIPLFFYKGVNIFDRQKIDGIHFNILDEHPVQAIRKRP